MRNRELLRYLQIGLAVAFALAMIGCEQKSINEIRANPSKYANKDVSVVGSVTRSYSVLGRGAYEVDDGTGKLWIVSDKGVPREGARVGVKGTIRDGYNLGGLIKLPEAVSSGMVMIEKEHKAK
jgi:hypothetical protein